MINPLPPYFFLVDLSVLATGLFVGPEIGLMANRFGHLGWFLKLDFRTRRSSLAAALF